MKVRELVDGLKSINSCIDAIRFRYLIFSPQSETDLELSEDTIAELNKSIECLEQVCDLILDRDIK